MLPFKMNPLQSSDQYAWVLVKRRPVTYESQDPDAYQEWWGLTSGKNDAPGFAVPHIQTDLGPMAVVVSYTHWPNRSYADNVEGWVQDGNKMRYPHADSHISDSDLDGAKSKTLEMFKRLLSGSRKK